MIYFLFGAILLVFTIIGLTVWAVMTKKYDDGDTLDEIQHLSDLAAELADTAQIYKRIGMDKEAQEAFEESERLNARVWEVINGANTK
jgi:nitrogen fixation-related uncharacterized protein